MATDFWKDYEPEPHKGLSEHMAQVTNGRVRIDPVTGDVGIGTAPAQLAPVPLTDGEIRNIGLTLKVDFTWEEFARAIEAAHGITAAAQPAPKSEKKHD